MNTVGAALVLLGLALWKPIKVLATIALTWMLWTYSVGTLSFGALPLSLEKPEFLPYMGFWLLVGIGARSARAIWHKE